MNKLNVLKKEILDMEEVLALQSDGLSDLEETVKSCKERIEKLETLVTKFGTWAEDALKALDSLNASEDLINTGASIWLESSQMVVKYTDEEVVSPIV